MAVCFGLQLWLFGWGYGVASRLLHMVMLVDALLGCLLCVDVSRCV